MPAGRGVTTGVARRATGGGHGRPNLAEVTPRSTAVGLGLVAALLGGACSPGRDGSPSANDLPPDDDGDAVVAEVTGVRITRAELQEAMAEPGVLDYLRVPDPGEDIEGSDAARAVLGSMIDDILLDKMLERHGVEVDEATLARAEQATAPETPDPEGAELHEPVEPHPAGILAEQLSDELAFDEFARDADNAEAMSRELFAIHPALSAVTCGEQLAVRQSDAEAVRRRITEGYQLADAAAGAEGAVSTGDGSLARCVTEADIPAVAHRTVLDTGIGEIGEVTVFSPAMDEVVTLFVEPAERREGTDDEVAAARARLAERLTASGAHAYEEVTYAHTPVEVDPAVGVWDEHGGVVPSADDIAATTFERTGTTTTTTTTAPPTTTTAPPPTTDPPPADAGGLGAVLNATDPGTADPLARGRAALESGVPGNWRAAIPVQLSEIGGSSSYSSTDGSLQMGSHHLLGDWSRLVAISSHEFGHHIAFRYGTQAELGAAPEGWPTSGSVPVEHWADCVSRSFTGYPLASHHQTECSDPELGWTAGWVSPGPDIHPRTG